MGNFLFQAAAAIGYAFRHGQEYTLPNTTKNPKWDPIYLQHLVHPRFNNDLPYVTLTEKQHQYQELPWEEKWKDMNVFLDGYWQTEKYFKEFRSEILSLFGFPHNPMPGHVSVHVRRTDYLKLVNKHPRVTMDWYLRAMSCFPGHHFVFYSDDIPWCKANFGRRKDVSFSEQDEVGDLTHMSSCEHHICSASTFSWWGAWLNRNPQKRIIIPRQWFVPGHSSLDTSDIVPPEWTRL